MDALGRQFLATGAESIRQGDPVLLLVRPEDITVLRTGESGPEANTVVGRIAVSTFAGTGTHLEVMVAGQALKVAVYGSGRFDFLGSVDHEVRLQLRGCAVIRTEGDGA